MSIVACLLVVVVAATVPGLIHAALRRGLSNGPCVPLASAPRGWRQVQRPFAVAAILALLLPMIPVNVPPPSETTASLVSKVPAPLNAAAPFLSQAVAPLDALVPPFSNVQPAFADPTAGITVTKSAPPVVYQELGGIPAEIFYAITLTNPSGHTIGVGSRITDSTPLSATLKSGAPTPPWLYGTLGGDPYLEVGGTSPITTTSDVGGFYVDVDSPIPDRTIVTNHTYCFSGTVDATPTQFCESTPVTTEVRAPDFGLTESWTSASGVICAGQRLTYTISFSNPGGVRTILPYSVIGVITDPLTIYTDTLSSDATSAGNVITWSLTSDDLLANGGNTVTRTFAVSVPGSLVNGAYLTNTYTIASPEVAPTQDSWSSSGVTVSRATAAFTSTSLVCLGEATIFNNTSSGGTNSYEWNFGDGSPVTTTVNPVHVYGAVGDYTVTLTATGVCGTDVATDTVTVNPLPNVSFVHDAPVCLGQTMTFTNTGDVGSYQWDFGDGSPVETSRDAAHTYATSGTFTVWLTTTLGTGCWDVYSDTVTVNPLPAVSFDTNDPVCLGETMVLTNTGDVGTYEWDLGDGSPIATSRDVTHTYAFDGNYTVWLTTTLPAGCQGAFSRLVTVYPLPTVSFTSTSPVCLGEIMFFTNTGDFGTYEWDFGDGSPIVTSRHASHTYLGVGSYTVWLTNTLGTGCRDVYSATVTVNPVPTAGFISDSPVCLGQSMTFTNTGSFGTYEWDFGDGSPVATSRDATHTYSSAGTFTVWLTTTLPVTGCWDVYSDTVTVNPVPNASFISDSPVCLGQTMTFTNTGSFGTYEWDLGDGSPIEVTRDVSHTYAATGTFTVWLTTTNACGSDVYSQTVVVSPLPMADFSSDSPVCLGQTMTFTNTGDLGSYEWDFGDGTPIETTRDAAHTYATSGSFTVWLTTTNACGSDVTSNTVTVNPLPSVSFVSNSPVSLGQTLFFTNTGDVGTYEWDFGDGSPIETTRDVSHTYVTSGTFTVWLTITLGTGCWDTYSAVVTVTDTTSCEDVCEPDDIWDEATIVTPPNTTRHSFDDTADVDWVGFWGTAGITYTIETLILATNVDTKLNLYSWDGIILTLLASNDNRNPGDLSSLINWVVTMDGWYFVEAGRFTGSYYGCDAYYDLRISSGPLAYFYLPIILKNHPPPERPPPSPDPCCPLVETSIILGNDPRGVAYNGDDDLVYVANYVDGTVSVISGETYDVVATISGVAGANGVAYDSDHGLVYVTKRDSNELAVIDASTNTVSRTIPVGSQPHGVAYNPTSHKIYVANYGGNSVIIIDANTMTTTATISGLSKPAHVVANPVSNKVYVSNHGNGTVTVIRGTDDAVLPTVSLGSSGPYGIAADAQRNLIYVVSITVPDLNAPNLVTIDGATDQVKSDMWGRVNIHKKTDDSLVPLRVIAVHPSLGSSGHLYITSSSGDVAGDGSHGTDQLLMSRKGWPEGFNDPNPRDVGTRPEEGVAVDPVNNRVFVTTRDVNRLTVIRDTGDHSQLCVEPFALEGYVIEPVP